MKLSELKKQIDELSELAEKAEQDPEVLFATMPNFPMYLGLKVKIVSNLYGHWELDAANEPAVVLAEAKEVGYPTGEVRTALGWK